MKYKYLFFCLLALLLSSCSSSNANKTSEVVEEDVLATNIQLADQSGEKMPILAWTGLRTTEAPPSAFKDLADAGFTINLGHDLCNHNNAKKLTQEALFNALDQAAANGFKQIISCNFLNVLSPEDIEKLKAHPGLAGYHVDDEPTTFEKIAELKPMVEKVRTMDRDHYPYVNLAGADCRGANWAPLLIGCTGEEPSPFTTFVKTYVEELDLPMISFDVYPVLFNNNTGKKYFKPGWFYTLEIITKEAKAKNKEMWAFALSTGYYLGGLFAPSPTLSDLRLQMFTNLAYGAQCLQYYTYNDMSHDRRLQLAPITDNYTKTPVYYTVKEMNKEIAALSPVFLHAKMIWVAHTGEIPDGCTPLDKSKLPNVFKSLDINGNAVVSLLEKGEDNFLVVVNRNLQDSSDNITVKATGSDKLYRVNKESQPVMLGKGVQKLEPGDIAIYFWKK